MKYKAKFRKYKQYLDRRGFLKLETYSFNKVDYYYKPVTNLAVAETVIGYYQIIFKTVENTHVAEFVFTSLKGRTYTMRNDKVRSAEDASAFYLDAHEYFVGKFTGDVFKEEFR